MLTIIPRLYEHHHCCCSMYRKTSSSYKTFSICVKLLWICTALNGRCGWIVCSVCDFLADIHAHILVHILYSPLYSWSVTRVIVAVFPVVVYSGIIIPVREIRQTETGAIKSVAELFDERRGSIGRVVHTHCTNAYYCQLKVFRDCPQRFYICTIDEMERYHRSSSGKRGKEGWSYVCRCKASTTISSERMTKMGISNCNRHLHGARMYIDMYILIHLQHREHEADTAKSAARSYLPVQTRKRSSKF